ncbi:class IIb bacteriocin, lactobin A/cerein 7B family [Flavobacterium sp. FlaQc-48]
MNLEIVNFEDLGLVELNAQEVQEVEGGIWPIILIGLLLYSTNAY